MGSKTSKSLPKLKNAEIQEFSKQTLFSNEKIESLYTHFYSISTSRVDDGVIDYSEFCNTLNLSNTSYISERVFALFDTNHDGVINFREFLQGISTFVITFSDANGRYLVSAHKLNEQVNLSFRLFDTKRNARIYFADFVKLLKSAIEEHSALCISQNQLEEIAQSTFRSVEVSEDESGDYVTKETYRQLLWKNQQSLIWLSVDLERVAEGARRLIRRATRSKIRCF
jgi:serine/threonine-protein phosphatase 2B regulatory subunit